MSETLAANHLAFDLTACFKFTSTQTGVKTAESHESGWGLYLKFGCAGMQREQIVPRCILATNPIQCPCRVSKIHVKFLIVTLYVGVRNEALPDCFDQPKKRRSNW